MDHLACSSYSQLFCVHRGLDPGKDYRGAKIDLLWPDTQRRAALLSDLLKNQSGETTYQLQPAGGKVQVLHQSYALVLQNNKVIGLRGVEQEVKTEGRGRGRKQATASSSGPTARERPSQPGRDNGLLRALLDAIPEFLMVVDRRGRILLANNALARFLGVPSEELLRQPIQDFAQRFLALTEDPVHYERLIKSFYDQPKRVADFEVRLKLEPPRLFHVHSTSIRSHHDDDHAARLWVVQDISEQKLFAELQKNIFLTVSHEIKNPLAAIRGYLETVLHKPRMPAQTREEFLSIALKNTETLCSVVDNVLFLTSQESSQGASEAARSDLRAVFDSVRTSLQPAMLEGHVRMQATLPLNLPSIGLDHVSLFQVLTNLLKNAIKFSPRGGVVRIEAEVKDHQEVLLSIADQGPGIPEEFREKVFERFFRVPGTGRKGSGLGLAIVKFILDRCGGRIQIDSAPGGGTLVRLYLPAVR